MAGHFLTLLLLSSVVYVGHAANVYDANNQDLPICQPSSIDQTCDNPKVSSMEFYRARTQDGDILTTNQGVKITDNQNTLKAGERGPSLLEDFIMREKIMHFDHERIPERIVHARGAGAHGYFQVYAAQADWLKTHTKASFLQDPNKITPVFVRFSTVGGSRGSADTVRDVRGFATKFYTDEGNFDIVGNNMPIFFIQDAMKFPDFVHSVKPHPHNEIPQASSAHDNLYDFVTQQTETTHMMMWLMSDRAIPRSYAMMEGFGVHTFRLINAQGDSKFVKFYWVPKLGVHSLVWDETQKLAGKNSDFNRAQLWESIEQGNYPEWELSLQVFTEADEQKLLEQGWDILDPTKLIPVELYPAVKVGRMVLNRNPDNYFAETEQVAFFVSNIVPGIDFSNDPLMQGRLFSYMDTQLSRLGGPNHHEIPINRPICPFNNNHQRDGMHRQTVNVGTTNYDVNSINKGLPKQAPKDAGFSSYYEKIDAHKIRARSPSFADHFSQATLFWVSMSEPEQDHIVSAFTFELSKVQLVFRQRMLAQLQNVDASLASRIATNLGLAITSRPLPGYPKQVAPSPALSQANTTKRGIITRSIAILAADGVDGQTVADLKAAIKAAGGQAKVIAPRMGTLRVVTGPPVEADGLLVANPSILFDGIYIPGGDDSVRKLQETGDAVHYALEAYNHLKAIGSSGEGVNFLRHIGLIPKPPTQPGQPVPPLPAGVLTFDSSTLTDDFKQQFIGAVAQHRFFERERTSKIPA